MATKGDVGIILKVGMLAGLQQQEIQFVYNLELCGHRPCNCDKLHPIDHHELILFAAHRLRTRKGGLVSILPSPLWKTFRNLPTVTESDVMAACKVLKGLGLCFSDLHQIWRQVVHAQLNSQERLLMSHSKKFLEEPDAGMIPIKYLEAWQRVAVLLAPFLRFSSLYVQ
jgi:hypothetical protein